MIDIKTVYTNIYYNEIISYRRKFELFLLIVFALIVRLLFIYFSGMYDRIVNGDGFSYDQIANNILTGYGFAWGPGQPTAFRPFAYPWFLVVVRVLGGPSPGAVQIVQAVLGALTVLPVYLMGWRFAGHSVAFLAAIAMGVHPVLVYSTALLAPDLVAILFECIFIWFALQLRLTNRPRYSDIAGFVSAGALAILTRPEMVLVILLVAIALLAGRGLSRVQTRGIAIATMLAILLAVMPPIVRNWQRFKAFVPFPTIGGVTFWGANNPYATGGWLMPLPEYFSAGTAPDLGLLGWSDLTEIQSQNRFYRIALNWIYTNPLDSLNLIPKKIIRSFTLSYADENRINKLPFWINLINIGFIITVFVGIIYGIKKCKKQIILLLLAPITAWVIKVIIFYGSARQTSIVLPIMFCFAAFAVSEIFKNLRFKFEQLLSGRNIGSLP